MFNTKETYLIRRWTMIYVRRCAPIVLPSFAAVGTDLQAIWWVLATRGAGGAGDENVKQLLEEAGRPVAYLKTTTYIIDPKLSRTGLSGGRQVWLKGVFDHRAGNSRWRNR